jgi:MFS family permease
MTDSANRQTAVKSPEEANLPWNFAVNIVDISFYSLALNIVSQTTILPLLVSQLTTSKLAIGLVPAIFSLGFLLPQLFTAGYTERLRRKLPVLMLWSSLTERGPYLLIGLAIFLFARSAPGLALAAIYVLLGISATTGGMLTPAWYDLIAKVIPVRVRGVWSGLGSGLGALMSLAGAAMAGWFLSDWTFPLNYALCFAAAFVFFMLSWLGLALNREPESTTVKSHTSFLEYARQLPGILRRDRNYQVYLLSQSISNLGGMAAGFYIVYGAEKFQLTGAAVGTLTGVLVGSQALLNLVWGLIGDRKGHKLVLVGAAFCMALSAGTALFAHSTTLLGVVFFLMGASAAGSSVSSLNIILEFCAPEDRPTYIGLTNTLLAPSRTAAPLLGGWLASGLGYPWLFSIALAASLAGSLLMAGWMREPRHPAPGLELPA